MQSSNRFIVAVRDAASDASFGLPRPAAFLFVVFILAVGLGLFFGLPADDLILAALFPGSSLLIFVLLVIFRVLFPKKPTTAPMLEPAINSALVRGTGNVSLRARNSEISGFAYGVDSQGAVKVDIENTKVAGPNARTGSEDEKSGKD